MPSHISRNDHDLPLGTVPFLTITDLGVPLKHGVAGPLLIVVAGVHGDETTPIAVASSLSQVLEVDGAGRLVIVPAANPAAILAGSRYYSARDRSETPYDLNRMFPHGADTRRRAVHSQIGASAAGAHAERFLRLLDGLALGSGKTVLLDLHETLDRARRDSSDPVFWIHRPPAGAELELELGTGAERGDRAAWEARRAVGPLGDPLVEVPLEAEAFTGTLAAAFVDAGVLGIAATAPRASVVVESLREGLTRGEAAHRYLEVVLAAAAAIGLRVRVRWAGWKWRPRALDHLASTSPAASASAATAAAAAAPDSTPHRTIEPAAPSKTRVDPCRGLLILEDSVSATVAAANAATVAAANAAAVAAIANDLARRTPPILRNDASGSASAAELLALAREAARSAVNYGQAPTMSPATFARTQAKAGEATGPTVRFSLVSGSTRPDFMPRPATQGAAGFDLPIEDSVNLPPNRPVLLRTGLRIEIPPGYQGQIVPRGSTLARGLHVQTGTVDSDYRGELVVVVQRSGRHAPDTLNRSSEPIAQLVISPIVPLGEVRFERVDDLRTELEPTARGEGRLGSTTPSVRRQFVIDSDVTNRLVDAVAAAEAAAAGRTTSVPDPDSASTPEPETASTPASEPESEPVAGVVFDVLGGTEDPPWETAGRTSSPRCSDPARHSRPDRARAGEAAAAPPQAAVVPRFVALVPVAYPGGSTMAGLGEDGRAYLYRHSQRGWDRYPTTLLSTPNLPGHPRPTR